MSRANVALLRKTHFRVGKRFGGAPVALVTTVGRKSQKRRTVPLLFMRDGSNFILVASKGGMSTHPDWYFNLLSNPELEIVTEKVSGTFVARTADADEKAALWPRLVEVYKSYQCYQDRTDRDIPVLICEPHNK